MSQAARSGRPYWRLHRWGPPGQYWNTRLLSYALRYPTKDAITDFQRLAPGMGSACRVARVAWATIESRFRHGGHHAMPVFIPGPLVVVEPRMHLRATSLSTHLPQDVTTSW